MFLFRSFFQRKEPEAPHTVVDIPNRDRSTGDMAFRPVLAINEGDDGYTDVQFRTLTYAEVAALRGARSANKITVPYDDEEYDEPEDSTREVTHKRYNEMNTVGHDSVVAHEGQYTESLFVKKRMRIRADNKGGRLHPLVY
ncbi:hypothetical protein TRVA0_033S01596 [Trichomonascus vanleenenianus]|uniref:uncharacterized protein n=1 Tax=Trichomonascus vanleenenianus TaxID=2268995 RepID=UPI003EC9A3DE